MVDKSIIGTEMGGSTMVVERGKVMEFARAIADENAAYFAEDPPIPLTYTMAQAHWPVGAAGAGQGAKLASLGLNLLRILHAGQEFEYLAPIKVGDTLTSKGRISDVYEKEGKAGGKMVFVVSESTFTNQRGEDVLIARTILAQTEKAAS